MNQIYLEEVHTTDIDRWIAERHYLRSTPAGAVIRMRFSDAEGNTLGAMLWGRNPSPKQDQHNVLCLTRMCFVDDTEHCIESRALAMARKYIRKHYAKIIGLVAYSSTGEGHEGVVYKADGWFEVSRSKENHRDTRIGRQNRDVSAKIKWVRSV